MVRQSSAKALFIGSIPIAASIMNNIGKRDPSGSLFPFVQADLLANGEGVSVANVESRQFSSSPFM